MIVSSPFFPSENEEFTKADFIGIKKKRPRHVKMWTHPLLGRNSHFPWESLEKGRLAVKANSTFWSGLALATGCGGMIHGPEVPER